MAQTHYKGLFKKALLQFVTEPDPVLAMLEWVAGQMMQIEAEAKVGAEKGKHSKIRTTHFSGRRVRRLDTRLGTIYLYVPKIRKGGYVPFFVTERKMRIPRDSGRVFRRKAATIPSEAGH